MNVHDQALMDLCSAKSAAARDPLDVDFLRSVPLLFGEPVAGAARNRAGSSSMRDYAIEAAFSTISGQWRNASSRSAPPSPDTR